MCLSVGGSPGTPMLGGGKPGAPCMGDVLRLVIDDATSKGARLRELLCGSRMFQNLAAP